MPYPDALQISYSYTGFQQSQGDNSFPGTQLDNDLANVRQFASQTADFLALIARSDGVIRVDALPTAFDLSTYTKQAMDAAVEAGGSAGSAALAAAAASGSAQTASDAAASAAATLAGAALKSANLSDLANAGTARTNLGLGTFATKSSILLSDFGADFFTADTTGRAKFADGIWTTAKIANNAIDHTKLAAGTVVQVVRTETSAAATSSAIIPNDDTIPTSTEGTALTALNTTITPKSATNILIVECQLWVNPNVTATAIVSLFRDAETSARAVGFMSMATSNSGLVTVKFQVTAGSTSATTFGVRFGPNVTATITVNGVGAGRYFGGALLSYLQVTEIKA